MATTVASIMVGSLTSTALYVDHFVCEVYGDALLEDLVAQDSAQVKNVSGVWTQQGVMTFTGLALGATYYLRAGVVAPLSGLITWSATFSLQAGISTAPAPAFIFTSAQTGSGVSFTVTPSVVPANIDHYQAWWSMDGTVPALTQKPMWTGPLNNATFFTFFVGCTSVQTPTVYVRGVNTSGAQQAWITLVTLGGGTLDNIADGTSFVKGAQFVSGVVAVPNGNFEASTSMINGAPPGWNLGGLGVPAAAVCYYVGPPWNYVGTQALNIQTSQNYAGIVSTQKIAVTPGDSWKITGALCAVNTGCTAVIELGYVNSADEYIGSARLSCPFVTGGVMTYMEDTAVVPAGAVYGLLLCQVIGAPGNAVFDAIQLIRLANLDDEVLDGTTYVRLADVNGDHTFHVSSALNPQGSLTGLSLNTFAYDYTTTSITWGWGSYEIYCPDGTVATIGASTYPAFTGLAIGTYYFSFYYDLNASATVVLMSDVGGGKSPSSLQQQAQVVNGDGHVPININVTAVVPSSGSGGGGGGGGGGNICFTPLTRVLTDNGVKTIIDVRIGDRVLTARGTWRAVVRTTCTPYKGLMHCMCDPEYVTPGHLILRQGVWVRARELYPDTIPYEGTIHNLHVECAPEDDGSAPDTEHSYTLANGAVVHNLLTSQL